MLKSGDRELLERILRIEREQKARERGKKLERYNRGERCTRSSSRSTEALNATAGYSAVTAAVRRNAARWKRYGLLAAIILTDRTKTP